MNVVVVRVFQYDEVTIVLQFILIGFALIFGQLCYMEKRIVALIIVQWLLETKGVGCRTFAHHGRDGQRVAVKDYAIKRVP